MANPNQLGRFRAKQMAVTPRGDAWANPSKGGTANKSGGRGRTDTASFTTQAPRKG